MNIFGKLLPGWVIYAVIAALVALLGVQQVRVSNAKQATADARQELANDRTLYAQAAQAAELAARTEETRRAEAVRKAVDEAHTQNLAAQADAADARNAADRLRERVAALVAASRQATGNPAVVRPSAGEQGGDALDLLADVFSRADSTAGELAAYADRLRVAGAACERIADDLQPAGR